LAAASASGPKGVSPLGLPRRGGNISVSRAGQRAPATASFILASAWSMVDRGRIVPQLGEARPIEIELLDDPAEPRLISCSSALAGTVMNVADRSESNASKRRRSAVPAAPAGLWGAGPVPAAPAGLWGAGLGA